MPPRALVSLLAVLAVLFERFAYYAARSQFTLILLERGTDKLAVIALKSSMATWALLLPVLFAVVAVLVPRAVVALLGLLIACVSCAVCVFAPEAFFEAGLWFLIIGTSAFKAVSFALCAEYVAGPRAKAALVMAAYVALNVGAFFGPFMAGSLQPSLRLSLGAYVLAAVVGLVALGLSLRPGQAVNEAGRPSLSSAVVLLLALPTLNAAWLADGAIFSSEAMTTAPVWMGSVSGLVTVCLTMAVAALFALLPARLLPTAGLGSLLLGVATVAGMVTAMLLGWPRSLAEVVGLLAVGSVGEVSLAYVVMALAIAMARPRFAPLLVTSFAVLTSLHQVLGELPPGWVKVVAGGLLLLGLPLAAGLVAFRKPLLGGLDPESA